MTKRGTVFVISAPSGAGKHTVLRSVFARDKAVAYSVSATTRPPRATETNGVDYFFLDRAAFLDRVEQGGFFEWAEVHGNLYGTPRRELEQLLVSGKDVILELDVQGMKQLKKTLPEIVTVFIAPPSMEELETRLRGRGTEQEAAIAVRLKNARAEMAEKDHYDHVIVNDSVERAADELLDLIRASRTVNN